MKTILLSLLLSLAVLTLSSCEKSNPVNTWSSTLPPLSDSIPFSKLGSGKLVFERIGSKTDYENVIYVVDIDHQDSWIVGGGLSGESAVSPDGQKIAYSTVSSPPEAAYDIYIMDIDGSGSQRVSDIKGTEQSPSWTPDGKQIVFYSWLSVPEVTPSGVLNDLVYYRQSPAPNPTDRTRIFDLEVVNAYYPEGPVSVSPNGRMAVFSNWTNWHGIDVGIYTFDSGGTNIKKINGTLYSPSWSPDGKYLAALAVRYDNSTSTTYYASVSIALFDSNSAEPTTLVTLSASGWSVWSGANTNSLCWSPDGSKIAFTRPEGNDVQHIYIINRDGTGLTQVTSADSVTDRSVSWGR
jgi:Tol biopolymer transport system component